MRRIGERSNARRTTTTSNLNVSFHTDFVDESARDAEVVRLIEEGCADLAEPRLTRWFLNFEQEASAHGVMSELTLGGYTTAITGPGCPPLVLRPKPMGNLASVGSAQDMALNVGDGPRRILASRPEAIWRVVVERVAPVDHFSVARSRDYFHDVAARHNGSYSGWETFADASSTDLV